ncbi:hypothetical protein JB92DRAFT_3127276 [Gautieria morchelliformis]|nr:hypothetical protein JB92DRAFT_3127276 [Gautieria morchelliformis]
MTSAGRPNEDEAVVKKMTERWEYPAEPNRRIRGVRPELLMEREEALDDLHRLQAESPLDYSRAVDSIMELRSALAERESAYSTLVDMLQNNIRCIAT